MLTNSQKIQRNYRGFSLVEVMVGLVIGMLGMIITMQVYALFEGQKRTTSGGGDAQNAGAIALYGLQRDIQQAGYGISASGLIGCGVTLQPSGVTINAFAPVTINSANVAAGDANTDTVLVAYGNSNSATEGDGITAQPGNAIYAMQTPASFLVNDLVVAEPQIRPAPCNLTMDTVTAVANPNVTVNAGTAGVSNGTLYNLGQAPTVRAYAVRNGNLTTCDYRANNCGDAAQVANTAIWAPIANDIVSLRAQYGQDTSGPPMDGIVDLYNQTTPTTACGWIKAPALRLVLVARNGQFEKTAVTAAAPAWLGGPASGVAVTPTGSANTPVALTANANWQNYRYKVFQTVVPLRNITSMGAVSGC